MGQRKNNLVINPKGKTPADILQPAARVKDPHQTLNPQAIKRKATLARMERDRQISRGIHPSVKNKRKGIDKKNARVYTVSTIKLKIKEGIQKMALFNKNKTAEADKPKQNKKAASQGWSIPTSGVMGVLLMVVCVSAGYNVYLVLAGTTGLLNQVMAAPTVIAIVAFLFVKAAK